MSSLVKKNESLAPTCECGVYFKYIKFNNLCSECYINKYGDKIDDKLLLNLVSRRRYSKEYLENLVNSRSLPKDHFLWISLKHMFETGCVIKDTNYLDWVKYLEKNTIYRGISVKQALELKSLADNSKNQYKKKILKEEEWHLGHNICCLIIDWWNIPNEKIARAQCYYYRSEEGTLPRISDGKIELPAIFNRKCKKKYCKNYCDDVSKCCISHNHMFEFTLRNIAQNY